MAGATDYTFESGGEFHERSGDLVAVEVTQQASDNVSGTRATGRVGGGYDGSVVPENMPGRPRNPEEHGVNRPGCIGDRLP